MQRHLSFVLERDNRSNITSLAAHEKLNRPCFIINIVKQASHEAQKEQKGKMKLIFWESN